MSENSGQVYPAPPPRPASALRRLAGGGWSALALLIAGLVLMPVVAVVWFALWPTENIWPHLMSTVLPRYLGNTLLLMVCVGVLSAMVGTGAAWLVTMYRFAGRSWLQWALLMPLAVPAYVGAYALVDFFEYPGPVQTLLRSAMGWENAQDYWFPHVRSRGAAIVVLTASLYPYVYLLARAALREQSGASYEVARALGVGPWGRFYRVGLPLIRPAIAAGMAVVMMETVNDFGTVDYFAVQTLTTGILSVWLNSGNLGGAAQISTLVLTIIVVLVTMEKLSRRQKRHFTAARGQRPVAAQPLTGWRGWLATGLVALPFLVGFAMPVLVLLSHAFDADQWAAPGLIQALVATLIVCGIAALITVMAAVLMVFGARLTNKRLPLLLLPVTSIGYAAPGAVLAVGLMMPMAAVDHRIADGVLALTGYDPGLMLRSSGAVLILAYMVRFFAIAQGTADAALGRIAPSLPMAARSLGRGPSATLRSVQLPLLRASLGSALLLVFVDCVKELPATLLLRPPFGFDTLATRVYAKASLENIAEAAPAALTITLVGLVAVTLLARANR